MALIGTVLKQPREILPVDISYAKAIGARTYSSITPSVEVPAGMTLSATVVSGTTVQLVIAGGTSGQTYKWTLLSDVVMGGVTSRLEDEFIVLVEES